MQIKNLKIEQITPYWKNPRIIGEDAVEAVMESINRYGYQKFIVVDKDNCILAGHTRLEALKRLNHTVVPVIVSEIKPAECRADRVADNKNGEDLQYNDEKLLDQFYRFIPDIEGFEDIAPMKDDDIPAAADYAPPPKMERPKILPEEEIVCPTCYAAFKESEGEKVDE